MSTFISIGLGLVWVPFSVFCRFSDNFVATGALKKLTDSGEWRVSWFFLLTFFWVCKECWKSYQLFQRIWRSLWNTFVTYLEVFKKVKRKMSRQVSTLLRKIKFGLIILRLRLRPKKWYSIEINKIRIILIAQKNMLRELTDTIQFIF